MKKGILLMCFCVISALNGQEKNKFILGGTVSADIGRFNDRFEVTPTVQTKVLPKIYLGIGATFAYYKQVSIGYLLDNQAFEVTEYDITTKTTYYGGNLFVRYFPFENKKKFYSNLYLQSELEFLKGNGKYQDITGNYKFKTDNKTIFTGIGYKHLIGNKFALSTSLMFKLNNENDSPYRNPLFRIGFEF